MPASKSTLFALLILAGSLLDLPAWGQSGQRRAGVVEPAIESALQWVNVEPLLPVQYSDPLIEASPYPIPPDNVLCCTNPNYWARADYLLWYLDGADVPALVTTSRPGTDRNDAGILGLSTTSVLFGGQEQGDGSRSGGRIELGRWFPSRGGLGIHIAYFGVEDSKDRAFFNSNGTPILARPFFSVEPTSVGPNAELVAFPNELEGNIAVDNRSRFEGGEVMLHWLLERSRDRTLQFVVGYQGARLDDDLAIVDFKRVTGGSSGLAIGTTLAENDFFRTENRFNGFAIGVLASARNCNRTLDAGMQLALGNTNSRVLIAGSTTSSVPIPGGGTDVATTPGGLLALPSNIGIYENDTFAVVPQFHVDLGWEFYPGLRALLGYRFLYWSQVARAGDQVDPVVNLSQLDPSGINGEPRPRFDFLLTDFWAQGINLGLDYRW